MDHIYGGSLKHKEEISFFVTCLGIMKYLINENLTVISNKGKELC